jgi:hypothetical protein
VAPACVLVHTARRAGAASAQFCTLCVDKIVSKHEVQHASAWFTWKISFCAKYRHSSLSTVVNVNKLIVTEFCTLTVDKIVRKAEEFN